MCADSGIISKALAGLRPEGTGAGGGSVKNELMSQSVQSGAALGDANRPLTPERVKLAGTAVGGGCIAKAIRAACSARTIRFGVLYEAVGAVCCRFVDDLQAAVSGRNGYDAQRGQQWLLGVKADIPAFHQ
jgi:hypothetical protein